jgi:hypothetical protein
MPAIQRLLLAQRLTVAQVDDDFSFLAVFTRVDMSYVEAA